MPRFRFENLWRISWHIATSDYLLGVVLFTLAMALLLAAWLPQTSADGLNQDLDWQGEVQRRFGEQAWFDTIRSPLQALGAFHVADAIGLRVLLALLALSLLARLVDSVDATWREWPSKSSPQEPEATERNATDGQGVIPRRPGQRFWRELGSAGIYLGGLVILVGAAVTSRSSWQTGPLPVTPGESVALGHGSDLTLRLESLEQDGRRGVGQIWRGGEELVGSGQLAVGQPLTGGGAGAFLVGSGMGLRVQATLSETQTLELVTGPDTSAQDELILAFTEDEARHLVGVPEADLVLLLNKPESDQPDARPQIQVFESGSGELILEQDAPEDTLLTVSDVSFVLMPIPYAQIRVIHDLGAFWSQLGALILSVGALVRFWRSWSRHPAGSDAPPSDADVSPSVAASDTRDDRPTEGGM